MGGEKKPLVMCELSCADGCGREMGAENCADGCGRRGCKGVAIEIGEEKKPLVMSELGCADGRGREMGWRIVRTAADGVGAREWLEMGGEKMGEEAAGELRGRLRTAWVQGGGWKWVGRRTRCSPRTRMLTRMLINVYAVTQNNFLQ